MTSSSGSSSVTCTPTDGCFHCSIKDVQFLATCCQSGSYGICRACVPARCRFCGQRPRLCEDPDYSNTTLSSDTSLGGLVPLVYALSLSHLPASGVENTREQAVDRRKHESISSLPAVLHGAPTPTRASHGTRSCSGGEDSGSGHGHARERSRSPGRTGAPVRSRQEAANTVGDFGAVAGRSTPLSGGSGGSGDSGGEDERRSGEAASRAAIPASVDHASQAGLSLFSDASTVPLGADSHDYCPEGRDRVIWCDLYTGDTGEASNVDLWPELLMREARSACQGAHCTLLWKLKKQVVPGEGPSHWAMVWAIRGRYPVPAHDSRAPSILDNVAMAKAASPTPRQTQAEAVSVAIQSGLRSTRQPPRRVLRQIASW